MSKSGVKITEQEERVQSGSGMQAGQLMPRHVNAT